MRASDRAYAALRDSILEAELPAGSVLAETEQSERLGVSRTPLREALARLVADGLAEPQAGRGLIVSAAPVERAQELFALREALETAAVRLAARHRDEVTFAGLRDEFLQFASGLAGGTADVDAYYALVARFDAAIDAALQNDYLQAALARLRIHLLRLRRLARDDRARLAQSAREHLAIVEAILDGEPELAAHATQVHLYLSLKHISRTTDRNTES